jgi:hypothetical protein
MKYARTRISSSDGPAVFAATGRFGGLFLSATTVFFRVGGRSFLAAAAAPAVVLLIGWGGGAPCSAGRPFLLSIMSLFAGIVLIGFIATIRLLKVGRLASEFSVLASENSNSA